MRHEQIKNRLIVSASIYVAILSALSILLFSLYKVDQKRFEKLEWLKSDVSAVQRKIDNLNKRKQEFIEQVAFWESLTEDEKNFTGLKINSANTLLNELKEKYHFSKFDIVFSKPLEYSVDGYKNEYTTTMFTDVKISYSNFLDVLVFAFLEELTSTFPGHVHFKKFSLLHSSSSISELKLEELAQKGTTETITGEIEFTWLDLKSLETENATAEGNTNNDSQ